MKHYLKDSGFKITVPRRKILEALENANNKHLSAEDLYSLLKANGEDIGLATIYRVLAQFEVAKIVIKHNFEEERRSVFELVADSHNHLVCRKCGKIIEFFDEIIENKLKETAKQHNFKILEHSLCIRGICSSCD